MLKVLRLTFRAVKEITGTILVRIAAWLGFVLSCCAVILITKDALIDQFTAAMQYPCLMLIWGWVLSLCLALLYRKDRRNGFIDRFIPNGNGPAAFYVSYRLCSVMHYAVLALTWLMLSVIFDLWPPETGAGGLYMMLLPWDTLTAFGLLAAAASERRRIIVPVMILGGIGLIWLSSWFVSPALFGEVLYGLIRLLPSEQTVLWTRAFAPGQSPLEDPALLPVYDALFTLAGLAVIAAKERRRPFYGRQA